MFDTISHTTCLVLLAGLTLVACAAEEPASIRTATLASFTDEAERCLGPDVAPEEEISVALPRLSSAPIPGAKVLVQGLQLRYKDRDPRFFVIADEDAWIDFWETYTPDGKTAGPSVDFRVSFVLIGVQGVKSTGGYSITFSDLRQSGHKVHVVTDFKKPAPGESVEMAFTQPYIVVQIELARLTTRGLITFIFETATGQEVGLVAQTMRSPGPDVALEE